jgi:hypothetical protein
MAYSPQFNSFSLQDNNYITSSIEYRTIPARDLVLENIARKPGKKLIADEFLERHIKLTGWILGDNNSDLISKIDDLHTNVTDKSSGTLAVDVDREIEAIVASITIGDPSYSQSIVPIDIDFLAAEPFWKGPQQTVSLTVASGQSQPSTLAFTITVSGSVFAEPSITYSAPAGSGYTTTSGVIIEYAPTGQTVTWSGGGVGLDYSNFVKFDYQNQLILHGAAKVEPSGVFSRWEPGETNVTVTFSGAKQGGQLDFVYRPRYL